MGQGVRRRLTAEDWAHAALEAMSESGLVAVAVEPLAARLGTTKGSFYWHFENRDALVDAALALWEREHTEGVIAELEDEPDPDTRLRRLFSRTVRRASTTRTEVTLIASADDPHVGPVLRRVTARRLAYLADQFGALGFRPDEARRRALLAYSAYVGHAQMAHAAPDALPRDPADQRAYADAVIDTLTR